MNLNIFEKILLAELTIKEISFNIFLGLDKELVNQLINLSINRADKELAKFTSDKKRFKNFKNYEKWFSQNRYPFALVEKNSNKLAGVCWVGEKELPIYYENTNDFKMVTLAIRIYKDFRGKGIAKEFLEFSLNFTNQLFKNFIIWLAVDKFNENAINLYKKVGFSEIGIQKNQIYFIYK